MITAILVAMGVLALLTIAAVLLDCENMRKRAEANLNLVRTE